MELGPVEIFRTGSWTSMNGQKVTVTSQTLAEIAASYDPAAFPAPAVIGHPKTDAPAYAWAERVYVEGDKLKATLKEAAVEFVEWVRSGRYKKISVSLYQPEAINNPTPGKWHLKHVGFLGGAAPAVSGLAPVGFSEPADDALVFEESTLFAERAALARERADMQLEKLIGEGRVLPAQKDELLNFMESLDGEAAFTFSEGKSATQREWFLSYLKGGPKIVHFGALRLDDGSVQFGEGRGLKAPPGYMVDPEGAELYDQAQALARRDSISFAEAVSRIAAKTEGGGRAR